MTNIDSDGHVCGWLDAQKRRCCSLPADQLDANPSSNATPRSEEGDGMPR